MTVHIAELKKMSVKISYNDFGKTLVNVANNYQILNNLSPSPTDHI